MKTKRTLLIIILIIILATFFLPPIIIKSILKKPFEPATTYLVGFDYSSYDDPFGMAPVVLCQVRYDQSIDVTFPTEIINGERHTETRNYRLSGKQFSNILNGVDPKEIYRLSPECSDPDDVEDGGSCWLYVYGADDEIAKKCGGFCPTSDRFNEIRRLLFNNLPEEFLEDYSQFEEHYEVNAG